MVFSFAQPSCFFVFPWVFWRPIHRRFLSPILGILGSDATSQFRADVKAKSGEEKMSLAF